jgi:hypothetical protein
VYSLAKFASLPISDVVGKPLLHFNLSKIILMSFMFTPLLLSWLVRHTVLGIYRQLSLLHVLLLFSREAPGVDYSFIACVQNSSNESVTPAENGSSLSAHGV